MARSRIRFPFPTKKVVGHEKVVPCRLRCGLADHARDAARISHRRGAYVQKAAIGGVQFSTRADIGDARSLSKGMPGAAGREWGTRRDRWRRMEDSGTRESW